MITKRTITQWVPLAKESEETEVKKYKLIKDLEEAKLQTSKEWLDGFNKGIERAIELTEANRETEEDIPTVPRHVAREIEKISELSEGWDFQGLVAYLADDGVLGIKDNEGIYEWARLNKKLFLQLLGGNEYKVEELEEDAKD